MQTNEIASYNDSNVTKYRMSGAWKCFMVGYLAFFIIVCAFAIRDLSTESANREAGYKVFVISIFAGLLLLSLYGVLSAFITRIEIYSDRIKKISLFKRTEILFDAVAGFRIVNAQYYNKLFLMPKDSTAKKVKVDLIIGNKNEFIEWLCESFIDLDAADFDKEVGQAAIDIQLGESEDRRFRLLRRGKLCSNILNGAGFIVMIWAYLKPYPYNWVIGASAVLPFIVLGFAHRFRGEIQFDGKDQSVFPNIHLALMGPSLALFLCALLDFNISKYDKVWAPFILFSTAFFIITVLMAEGIRRQTKTLIMLGIFILAYGYGAVICLNCILDKSQPAICRTKIVGKKISSGYRHADEYIFTLSSWEPDSKEKEMNVGKDSYFRHEVGNSIDICLRNGQFGIPWFYER
jgi:hypothetical protein